MAAIEYIHLPIELLKIRELSDKQKMLLSLVLSFVGKGLTMSNYSLADLLQIHPAKVSAYISDLQSKGYITIENGQSKYRKIYFNQNVKVDNLLYRFGKSTLTKRLTITKRTKEVSKDTSAPSFSFPLRSGSLWELPQAKLSEYKTTYSYLDIPTELRKAKQWLTDNPQRRKTAKGMPKFLNNWLSRAGGNGKSNQASSQSTPRPRPFTPELEDEFLSKHSRTPTAEEIERILAK